MLRLRLVEKSLIEVASRHAKRKNYYEHVEGWFWKMLTVALLAVKRKTLENRSSKRDSCRLPQILKPR